MIIIMKLILPDIHTLQKSIIFILPLHLSPSMSSISRKKKMEEKSAQEKELCTFLTRFPFTHLKIQQARQVLD